ncbi:MAG: adenylate/guanylate cyclase domain-containing protein [Chloroflexi bacterium]|nr:adenylate/guanylate cyclase domain-containing protein [Chloroflexota bacterium]
MTTKKSTAGVPENKQALLSRIAQLEEDLNDLQLIYETTMEHGTALEEQLVVQNQRMEILQNKMRKYLSPQLFKALLGGVTDADTQQHTRVNLTVFFSDVVGFSPLTDSLEPEQLSAILNTYLTRMSEIAIKYGGTVDKFVGDAIMVFFGAPEFFDDVTHARNCVRMAIEMREELFRLREGWRQSANRLLQVRMGINTGFCTVGNFGSDRRMDYTAIGNQVNLASRLQYMAPADVIYMSSATHTLVEDLVEARAIGLLEVKGFHLPVESWELLGLREDVSSVTPFLEIDENHLRLKPLELDLANLPDRERAAIQKALARALVHLTPSRKE